MGATLKYGRLAQPQKISGADEAVAYVHITTAAGQSRATLKQIHLKVYSKYLYESGCKAVS